jgi:ankyrin repeat protein
MDPMMTHNLSAYTICEYYMSQNEAGDSDLRGDARKWLRTAAQGNGVVAIDNYSYIHDALNMEILHPEPANTVFQYENWMSVRLQFGSFRAAEELNQLSGDKRIPILQKLRIEWCSGIGAKVDFKTRKFVNLDELKTGIQQARSAGVTSINNIVISDSRDTLLHCVAVWGGLECVKYLIEEENADVNAQNSRGETPIIMATRAGQYTVIELLLSHDGDASLQSNKMENALHWLGSIDESHQRDVATNLSRAGASVNAVAERVGGSGHLGFIKGTPLHRAIHRKQFITVRTLLELGADPFITPPGEISAANLAFGLNLYQILPGILASPHRPRSYHPDNLDALQYSASSYTLTLLETSERMYYHGSDYINARIQTLSLLAAAGTTMELVDSGSGHSGLEVAVANGDLPSVQHLLSTVFRNVSPFTLLKCLRLTIEQRFKSIFSSLLNSRQSSITTQDLSECLCLTAETSDDIYFAEELLKRGVMLVDMPNAFGETPFFIAIRQGFFKLANFLRTNRANTNYLIGNCTLLGHLIVGATKIPLSSFKYILESNGPAATTSSFIVIPSLNCSVYHCMAANLELLSSPAATRALMTYFLSVFDTKTQLDEVNNEGDTALQCAIKYANVEVAKALIAAGADINSPGGELGISPLDMAKLWLINTPKKNMGGTRKRMATNRRADLHSIIATLIAHKARTNDDWVQEEDPIFLAAIKDELGSLIRSGRTKDREYLKECLTVLCSYFDPMAMTSIFGLDLRLNKLAEGIQEMFNGGVTVEITRRPPKGGMPGNMAVIKLKTSLASISNERPEDDISQMSEDERFQRAMDAIRMGWIPPVLARCE